MLKYLLILLLLVSATSAFAPPPQNGWVVCHVWGHGVFFRTYVDSVPGGSYRIECTPVLELPAGFADIAVDVYDSNWNYVWGQSITVFVVTGEDTHIYFIEE